MQKIIIHNGNKGIIVTETEGQDRYETVKKANYEFYSPFENKRELTSSEVFEEGKNAIGLRNFKKVQFHFGGENGSGVTTSYDCNIYTKPDQGQLKFMGKSKIQYITFEN